jgi:hypothetical protein
MSSVGKVRNALDFVESELMQKDIDIAELESELKTTAEMYCEAIDWYEYDTGKTYRPPGKAQAEKCIACGEWSTLCDELTARLEAVKKLDRYTTEGVIDQAQNHNYDPYWIDSNELDKALEVSK